MEPIPDAHQSANVTFKMEGPAFDDGIPIHLLVPALGDLQAILDKTYLGLSQRRRFSKVDRLVFQLKTDGILKGSVESDIGIVLTTAQTLMPFYSQLGPKGIWDFTKQTFEFLKTVFKAVKEDKVTPQYSFTGSDRSVLNVHIGDRTTTFNGPVFVIGEQALPHYQSLTRFLKEDSVKKIEFGTKTSPEVSLGMSEQGLFDFDSQVDENQMTIACEIFDFNKFENIGKLKVPEHQEVPAGDYRFQVIGDQNTVAFIEAMLEQAVKVICLKETAVNPLNQKWIFKLRIIKLVA